MLEIIEALSRRRGSQLSPATWDRILRLLLGSVDAILHGSRNSLGNHLCEQTVRMLLEIYLRSLTACGPKGELWNLLQKFCRRWIHRKVVVEQWNAVTLALTTALMKRMNAAPGTKEESLNEIQIVWASRVISTIQ